MEWDFIPQ